MKLEADSIYYQHGGQSILSGVYLSIEKGQTIGILGRNGSGKSTLFKIIFGALKPTYGSIKIDGLPTTAGFKKRLIQFLPQEGFLPDHLSLNYALKLFGQRSSDLKLIESYLGITDEVKVGQLSFGQKKIFECALLLNSPSPFVLLDEPFDGIAPVNVEGIRKLIREKSHHKGVLVTDHKYEEILKVSDQLLIIQSGQTRPIEKSSNALHMAGYLSDLNHALTDLPHGS